jgi:hypothetical protein
MNPEQTDQKTTPEIGSFEQQLIDLRQKTILDISTSEPPVRQPPELPPSKSPMVNDPVPHAASPQISEEEMRQDLLKYFQETQAAVRESAFHLALTIVQNQDDPQFAQTLQLLSNQISFFVNEKNLKIQMKLVGIIEVLLEKERLALQGNEKMFLFNLLDKFLSSNNRSLKQKSKAFLTQIFVSNQEPFFEALKPIMFKANPKMTKSLLTLVLENEEFQDLEQFVEMEEELSELCNKYYNHRMKDIKKGIFKLIQTCVMKLGEDFVSNISKLSAKDKGRGFKGVTRRNAIEEETKQRLYSKGFKEGGSTNEDENCETKGSGKRKDREGETQIVQGF